MTASELQVKLNRIIEEHGPDAFVFISEGNQLRDVTDLEFNFIDVPEWSITKPVVYIK